MIEPTYIRQRALMNTNESELYRILRDALGSDYLIVPQVHLEKMIKPKNWIGQLKYAVGHVSRWSVDFALFDPTTFSPILAIELNGDSHNEYGQMRRDLEKQKHLKEANIPLLTFYNHKLPNPVSLRQEVINTLGSSKSIPLGN
jgi:very-short-patch-repair endonuclease